MARDDQAEDTSRGDGDAAGGRSTSPERGQAGESSSATPPSDRDHDPTVRPTGEANVPDDSDGADEPDDPNDPELAPPSAPTLARVPQVDRSRGRVGNRLSGQPFAVYGVLAAGAFVLVTLLMIIWFSSDDDGQTEGPICTDTTTADAITLIKDGAIGQISIAYPPSDESEIETDVELPALLRLNLADGNCRNLVPQGPSGELDMYAVFGAAEWYNNRTGQRQIELDIAANDNIPESVLATSTPIPTPTLPVTETPVIPATPIPPDPTAPATATQTPTPTSTPVDDASPIASPAASPIT